MTKDYPAGLETVVQDSVSPEREDLVLSIDVSH